MGVQSLDPICLAAVGRSTTTFARIAEIRHLWDRDLSVDLICGLPGQTVGSLRGDIAALADLPVEHLSIYDLSVENDTRLQRDLSAGRIELPSQGS